MKVKIKMRLKLDRDSRIQLKVRELIGPDLIGLKGLKQFCVGAEDSIEINVSGSWLRNSKYRQSSR